MGINQFRAAAEGSQPFCAATLAVDAIATAGLLFLCENMNWIRHAFALDPPGPAEPTEAERPIVDRLCREVVRRRLTVPATRFFGDVAAAQFRGGQYAALFRSNPVRSGDRRRPPQVRRIPRTPRLDRPPLPADRGTGTPGPRQPSDPMDLDKIHVILATDCGSTTTKAILIEKVDGVFRQTFRGEAPTTVEEPVADVTVGVINAATEVGELAGRRLVNEKGELIRPARDGEGCDIYISTSSAGGGLQMMVAGIVREMTAASAKRAALGAGAIVMDVIAANDKRLPHEQIQRIRELRPDMILVSGGTDGGNTAKVVEIAERIAPARPQPRFGKNYRMPLIYAGNKDAADLVADGARRQRRAVRGAEPAAGARARKPRAGPRPHSRYVPRTRDGPRARLRQADPLVRRADHADAGSRRRHPADDRQAGGDQRRRRRHRRGDDRRVQRVFRHVQPHGECQPGDELFDLQRLCRGREWPTCSAGSTSTWTSGPCATGSKTR